MKDVLESIKFYKNERLIIFMSKTKEQKEIIYNRLKNGNRTYKMGKASRMCYVCAATMRKFADEGRIKFHTSPPSKDRHFTQKDIADFLFENEMPFDRLEEQIQS